jgi:hypothetical protein
MSHMNYSSNRVDQCDGCCRTSVQEYVIMIHQFRLHVCEQLPQLMSTTSDRTQYSGCQLRYDGLCSARSFMTEFAMAIENAYQQTITWQLHGQLRILIHPRRIAWLNTLAGVPANLWARNRILLLRHWHLGWYLCLWL